MVVVPAGDRRFLGSGRPRRPPKPFQKVGGFAPPPFRMVLGPPGPARPQTSTISGRPKDHVLKTQSVLLVPFRCAGLVAISPNRIAERLKVGPCHVLIGVLFFLFLGPASPAGPGEGPGGHFHWKVVGVGPVPARIRVALGLGSVVVHPRPIERPGRDCSSRIVA